MTFEQEDLKKRNEKAKKTFGWERKSIPVLPVEEACAINGYSGGYDWES